MKQSAVLSGTGVHGRRKGKISFKKHDYNGE